MESVLLDVAGHRRSPATMPGYHRRLRALVVLLWRSGLRISEALLLGRLAFAARSPFWRTQAGSRQDCSSSARILRDISSAALYEDVSGGCCARYSSPRRSPSPFRGTSQRWKWGECSMTAR